MSTPHEISRLLLSRDTSVPAIVTYHATFTDPVGTVKAKVSLGTERSSGFGPDTATYVLTTFEQQVLSQPGGEARWKAMAPLIAQALQHEWPESK